MYMYILTTLEDLYKSISSSKSILYLLSYTVCYIHVYPVIRLRQIYGFFLLWINMSINKSSIIITQLLLCVTHHLNDVESMWCNICSRLDQSSNIFKYFSSTWSVQSPNCNCIVSEKLSKLCWLHVVMNNSQDYKSSFYLYPRMTTSNHGCSNIFCETRVTQWLLHCSSIKDAAGCDNDTIMPYIYIYIYDMHFI